MSKIQEIANRASAVADLCQLLAAVEAKAKLTVVVRMVSAESSAEFDLDITPSQHREFIEPTLQRLAKQVGLSTDGFLSALGLLFDEQPTQPDDQIKSDIVTAVDSAIHAVPGDANVYDTSGSWYTTLHPEKAPADEFPGPRKT